MKNTIKLLLIIFASTIFCYTQNVVKEETIVNENKKDDNKVTLTVSGEGETKDEARQSALRSAIEQAFGTFISSKTEIINDELIKDEIASVSTGNIQDYAVLSEIQMPEGGYTSTLKVIVSVTKLTSFVKNKGFEVEFSGSLFSFNINQQILNEQNEIKAISHMGDVVKKLSDRSFNYKINAGGAKALDPDNQNWEIPLSISVSPNNNIHGLANHMFETLKGISLSKIEANNYLRLNKLVYSVSMAKSKKEYDHYFLRTKKSIKILKELTQYIDQSILNFKIDNGIDSFSLKEAKKKIYKIPNFTMNENMKMFYTTGLPPKRRINTGNSAWIRWIYKLYSDNSQFKDNFSFVKKLSDKMFFEQRDEEYWHYSKYIQFQLKIIKPGLIISFINFKIDKEYLLLETEDERTLEEINNIKGYKVFSME